MMAASPVHLLPDTTNAALRSQMLEDVAREMGDGTRPWQVLGE